MLLDSNIIIYAINRSSPKHQTAQKFIQINKNKLVVAQQNIMESLRVLTHPKFPNPMDTLQAIDAVLRISTALQTIHPLLETNHIALELIKKYTLYADKVFDAYLFATMLSHGIYEIATDNEKDFNDFEGIQIINPFKGTS